MKRLATLVLAASFSVSALVGMGRGASATPFSDVPANHWAYQYIQSLAADGLIDGYPDGNFKGDRPLTRYEMAAVVARVIAKLQANGANFASKSDLDRLASKADLDKLQKLIDALKDELDALGVRVTNLEDALSALDKRTQFAQSIQFHGTIIDNNTWRQRTQLPRSITNSATGRSGPADGIVSTYIGTPDNNSPLESAGGPQTILRFDDRFNFVYTINPNLTVSIPFRITSNNFGGDFGSGVKYNIEPDVVVTVAKAGALTNLVMRDGQLDNLKSSRTGLTYRAPDASQQGTFSYATQPFPKGFEFGGIVNGLTEFQASFTRVDKTLTNTLTGVADPNVSGYNEAGSNNPLFNVIRPQGGYTQTGAAQGAASLRVDTFNSGNGTLSNAYLRFKAVIGTIYISSYSTPSGTTTYSNTGSITSGPGVGVPGFYFLDGQNLMVFTSPIPAGAQVAVTYVGLGQTNNQQTQRYQYNVRINHKIKGLPGAEIGLSYNRIYDEDLLATTGDLTSFGPQAVNANIAGDGFGVISDTVFGIDAQLPLTFIKLGDPTAPPILFAEGAQSKYSSDYRNVAAISDTAGVVGLRLKFYQTAATIQYQTVGTYFFDGAPLRYFGNPPPTYQNQKIDFQPGFFGFANNLAINQTYDRSINGGIPGRSATAGNPALSFIYPVFNPFVAGGPSFYSSFAPNTQGGSATITSPIKVGDLTVQTRLFAQHLSEINANGVATATFGPQFATTVRATWDKVDLGGTVSVPAFGKKLAINASGSIEHLRRNDTTAQTYIPYNLSAAGYDPAALANFQAVGGTISPTGAAVPGGSAVLYYPNYINMYHTTFILGGAMPVTQDLVLGARYNQQAFYGANGTTLQQNIGQTKNQFDATLTYNVPKTTSSVGFAFRNSTYRENASGLSNYNFTQNREDVNFIVRF